ncbi:hypothetical protein SAMN05216567_121114 [Variovorax sp. OK605]|nr:hypothetical protein SAMN05216567_121114 [Variovorax sp. OK605]
MRFAEIRKIEVVRDWIASSKCSDDVQAVSAAFAGTTAASFFLEQRSRRRWPNTARIA